MSSNSHSTAGFLPAATVTLSRRWRNIFILQCVLVLAAMPIWMHNQTVAWDAAIYYKAVKAVQAGHDPYADAIAIQRQVHSQHPDQPSLYGPYSYVYSPMTLPLLRLVAMLSPWLAGALYFSAYLLGVAAEAWVGFQATLPEERNIFIFIVPLAMFFPGFLGSDDLLSGNVAMILYGATLSAALVFGWRHNRWMLFYLIVILASCFKAPLLTLLAIPVFSARRQWMPAAISAVSGSALFIMQSVIWPSLFRNYLTAVSLQFSFNRDFGSSPAGLFSGILYDYHLPYSPAGSIFYLCYALPLLGCLFYLSRRFLSGRFTINQWIPVLLLGVVLLNPRLMEYDTAILALPMALILWRFLGSFTSSRQRAVSFSVFFLAVNLVATHSWNLWKLTEGPLLVFFFVIGSWTLIKQGQVPQLNREPLMNQDVLAA